MGEKSFHFIERRNLIFFKINSLNQFLHSPDLDAFQMQNIKKNILKFQKKMKIITSTHPQAPDGLWQFYEGQDVVCWRELAGTGWRQLSPLLHQ